MIPYEFFAGDGMLTKPYLEKYRQGPEWSDNSSAKKSSLTSREWAKGYFYEVDLAGTQVNQIKTFLTS